VSFPRVTSNLGLAVLALAALAGCTASTISSPSQPNVPIVDTGGQATALGNGPYGPMGPARAPAAGCTVNCTASAGTDPADFSTVLGSAIQEENLAWATYERAILDLGDVAPFTNIAISEGRHIEALAAMFERRDWAVPVSRWDPAALPPFASVATACAAGVGIEIEDIALYDRLLARTDLPQDAQNVFSNLREASRSHLAAFQLCR
jgi:rubrerythrin